MRAVSTIQVTSEEDKAITRLKREMGLPTKKAVVVEGLKALRQMLQAQQRRRRLQAASRIVRQESLRINEEWAPLSSALKSR